MESKTVQKKTNPKKRPTIQQHQTNGPLGPPPDAPMPWQIPRDIVFAPGPAANDSDYLVIQPGMCLMYVSKNQVTHTKVMMFNWYIFSQETNYGVNLGLFSQDL